MATYYIRPDGDDTASGLTDALAWQTVDHVNTIVGAVAHVFKFAFGYTTDQKIIVGNADYTYTSYLSTEEPGTAPPLFEAAIELIGETWVQVGGTDEWQCTINALPKGDNGGAYDYYDADCVYCQFKNHTGAGPIGGYNDATPVGALYEWNVDNANKISVYGTADPAGATEYSSIKLFWADCCIDVNAKSGVLIHGLKITNYGVDAATSAGIYSVGGGGGTDVTTVLDCHFDCGLRHNASAMYAGTAAAGIKLLNSKSLIAKNCLFTDVMMGVFHQCTVADSETVLLNCAFWGLHQPIAGNAVAGDLTFSYDYCNFYGNRAYVGLVSGGGVCAYNVGTHNQYRDKPLFTTSTKYQPLPANICIDDIGYDTAAETLVDQLIPIFRESVGDGPSVGVVSHGVHMDAALTAKILAWQNTNGVEVCNHSRSHTAYIAEGEGSGTQTPRNGLVFDYTPGDATAVVNIYPNRIVGTTALNNDDFVFYYTGYPTLLDMATIINAVANWTCTVVGTHDAILCTQLHNEGLTDCVAATQYGKFNAQWWKEALLIQCIDDTPAATCVLTFDGTDFATTASTAGVEDIAIDLTTDPYNTLTEVAAYINSLPCYECSILEPNDYGPTGPAYIPATMQSAAQKGQALSKSMADHAGPGTDILTDPVALVWDINRLWTNEMSECGGWLNNNIVGAADDLFIWPFGVPDLVTAAGKRRMFNEAEDNTMVAGRLAYHSVWSTMDYSQTAEGGLSAHGLPCMNMDKTDPDDIDDQVRNLMGWCSVMGIPLSFYGHGINTVPQVHEYLKAIMRYGTYGKLERIVTNLKGLEVRIDSAGAAGGGTTDDSQYVRTDVRTPDYHPRYNSPMLAKGDYIVGITDTWPDIDGNVLPMQVDRTFGFRTQGGLTQAEQYTDPAFEILCNGAGATDCTVDVDAAHLFTVKTGGAADNLNITWAAHPTINDVINEINNNHGANYVAKIRLPIRHEALNPGPQPSGRLTVIGAAKHCFLAPIMLTYSAFNTTELQPDIGAYGYTRFERFTEGYKGS